jgi:hypothetical protein
MDLYQAIDQAEASAASPGAATHRTLAKK